MIIWGERGHTASLSSVLLHRHVTPRNAGIRMHVHFGPVHTCIPQQADSDHMLNGAGVDRIYFFNSKLAYPPPWLPLSSEWALRPNWSPEYAVLAGPGAGTLLSSYPSPESTPKTEAWQYFLTFVLAVPLRAFTTARTLSVSDLAHHILWCSFLSSCPCTWSLASQRLKTCAGWHRGDAPRRTSSFLVGSCPSGQSQKIQLTALTQFQLLRLTKAMHCTNLQNWTLDVCQEILHLLCSCNASATHQLKFGMSLLVSLNIILNEPSVALMSSELWQAGVCISLCHDSHVGILPSTLLLEDKNPTATIPPDIEVLDENPTWPISNLSLKFRIKSSVILQSFCKRECHLIFG